MVTYNESLLAGQMQGIQANIEKTKAALEQLRQKLRDRVEGKITRGKAPTVQSTLALVKRLLTRRHMSDLINVEVVDKTEQKRNGGVENQDRNAVYEGNYGLFRSCLQACALCSIAHR